MEIKMIKVNDIVELNSIEYRVVQLFGCLALILPMKGQSVDLIGMDADELNFKRNGPSQKRSLG